MQAQTASPTVVQAHLAGTCSVLPSATRLQIVQQVQVARRIQRVHSKIEPLLLLDRASTPARPACGCVLHLH